MDFFNIEVLTFAGVFRYHVLFVIRLKTREVQIVGITAQPCETWMKQMALVGARNLTDPFDGFLRGVRYLIMDRDLLHTACFRHMLKDSGTNTVRLPARRLQTEQENGIAEITHENPAEFWPRTGCSGRMAIER